MFSQNKNSDKNLKDPEGKLVASYGAGTKNMSVILSYTKTNKLITALYMVTDIIDNDEPLRNKLRTLGVEILSDMHDTPADACSRIDQVMSFLDIASTICIVSEMNTNILKKEFLELNQSIKESIGKAQIFNKQVNLAEFFSLHSSPLLVKERGSLNSKGHKGHTRIGVQKGSTLMQALSDKTMNLSNSKNLSIRNLDIKNQRRNNLINIIKTTGGNATIKDIKDKIKLMPIQDTSLVFFGEKTLQRELVSMVKEGVLNKTGEKRWSRYFLKTGAGF